MHRMFKHLRKSIPTLMLIVALLVLQAICDLALPTYSAAIVDVGIQQQGIEHTTPAILRESTFRALIQQMPGGDAERYVLPGFQPISAEDAAKLGVTMTDAPLMALRQVDGEQMKTLDAIFSKAFVIQSAINGERPAGAEALPDFKGEGEFSVSALPQSMMDQAANQAVRAEYRALGMDLDAVQSRSIWAKGLLMLLMALLGAAAAVLVGYFGSAIAAKLGRDLRRGIFHHVVHFGQQEMEGFSTASLITRSTNDVQQVQMVMVMLLRMVIYAPIIGVGGALRALQTNQSMGWIIFVGVLLVITLVVVIYSLGMPKFKRMQSLIDRVNQVVRETLTGLPVIRAFCTQKREEERFDEASTRLMKTQLFVNRLMSGVMPLMILVMNGIAILILWVGARSIEGGAMQVGDMLAFIQYTMRIIMAFLMISMMSIMLPRASVSAKRIQEVLDTTISVRDPKASVAFSPAQRGVVEFRDVSFRYPDAEADMLSHISFVALPGQTTAVLGGTGSGKSTLVNLVPRFFDVSEGQILVDGVDVRQASLRDLRARIGYVPQKGMLFSGTVMGNITFGSSDISEDRAGIAARIAQAEDFILEREGGYDSEIAQGGANVSGGQKQRLSIARAIAKDPEIYIFDDSFSALDFKTDAALRAALIKAAKNATLIIVAQRISTVMRAEQILVLDEGVLVGKGVHEELMNTCEVYRQIAFSQLSKEELGHAES